MKHNHKFNLIAETVDEMQITANSVARSYNLYGPLLDLATDIRRVSIFSNFEHPKYTTFSPFPYQWDAVDLMLNKFEGRGVFADQVGLGKTVQALLTAHIMFMAGEITNCVVIASKNLLPQWRKEVDTKFKGVFNFIGSEESKEVNFSAIKNSLNKYDGESGYVKPTIYFISLESLKLNLSSESEFRHQIRAAEKEINHYNDLIAKEMERDSYKSDEQKDFDVIANYLNAVTKSMKITNEKIKVYLEKKAELEEKISNIKSSSLSFQKIDLLIVDEAHAPAKNKEQSLLLQKLNKTYCILISATPIRESIDDIYNLIKIVDGNRFPTIENFYEFCGARSISELISEDGSFEKVSKLNGLINSLFTRKRLYDPIVIKSFELKSDEISPFLVTLSYPDEKAAQMLLKLEKFKDFSLEDVTKRVTQIKNYIHISAGIIKRKAEIPVRPDLLKMYAESIVHDRGQVNEITLKYISRGLMEYYKETRDILVLDYLDWSRPPKIGECFLVNSKEEAFEQIKKLFRPDTPETRDNKTKVLIFAKSVAEREEIRDLFAKLDPQRTVYIDSSNQEKKGKNYKVLNMAEFKEFREENYDSIYLIDKTRKEGADFNIASRLVLFQMESPNSINLIDPLEMEQLVGRISRVGQKERCKIYLFAYTPREQELFNLYNDPDGLDLFGKCSTEIDFVVPIITEYFNKKYSHDPDFVNMKKTVKERSFIDIFTYAFNSGGQIYEEYKMEIRKICYQFLTDLKSNEEKNNGNQDS